VALIVRSTPGNYREAIHQWYKGRDMMAFSLSSGKIAEFRDASVKCSLIKKGTEVFAPIKTEWITKLRVAF